MTTCNRCGKELKGEIVAVHGFLFCCESCALDYIIDDVFVNVKEVAKRIYNEDAEVVMSEDILGGETDESM